MMNTENILIQNVIFKYIAFDIYDMMINLRS